MALTKWLPPTTRHTLKESPGRVTWLELFFDLVYVAALIQLGDQLSSDVTWRGVGRFLGIFVVLWWTWTGTTAYVNRFATDDVVHRTLVFVQMFAVANIALLAVAPVGDRWTWVAVAYTAARVPLLLMYARVLPQGGDAASLARTAMTAFSIGAGLFAVSIVLDGPVRFVVWAVAIGIEFAAPLVATKRLAGPPMHEHHLRERYAVFTIIVFGETFVKTLTELAEHGITLESQVFGGVVFIAAVALWWTYFDDIAESDIRRSSRWYRAAWVYGHLPLTAALTAFGVGSKKLVVVESFGEAITPEYLWLFGGAIAVTLVATAGLDLVTVSPHFGVSRRLRTAAPLVAAAAVVLVAATAQDAPALLVAGLLALIVVWQIAAEVLIAARADRLIARRLRDDLDRAADGCGHLATTTPVPRPTAAVCSICQEHDVQWVELRQCQECGAIGCCDDSPGAHATRHWEATAHPVIASIEPGAHWAYCYVDEATEDPWSRRERLAVGDDVHR